VAGFITIDDIMVDERRFTSLGGPPSYAGYAASIFNARVRAVSRIGRDFPDEYLRIFLSGSIDLGDNYKSYDSLTTRFRIRIIKNERELRLLYKCEEPDPNALLTDADALILNSVTGELKFNRVRGFIKNFSIRYLDPQGYLRVFDSDGRVKLRRPDDISFIKHFNIIKVDEEEALVLTGIFNPVEAASKLSSYSNGIVILTMGERGVIIANRESLYSLPAPNVTVVESTGMGDILGGIFVSEYVRGDDALWAVSLGVAGASIAGSSGLDGINKVIRLDRNKVIDVAHEIYEKYRKL